MFGFITEIGDRLIAVIASLRVLSDNHGNILITDAGNPILVEGE